MSTASSRMGGIKSVQRGVHSAPSGTSTVTISAVNPAKSELRRLGASGSGTYIRLTNATTITVENSGGSSVAVSWELSEHN